MNYGPVDRQENADLPDLTTREWYTLGPTIVLAVVMGVGAFSSAFFLYGIALAFVVSGSTRLERVAEVVASGGESASPLVWLALGLLLVGFAFKVSVVPFHAWAPDAYEGAPAVVTGFMSTGVKVAAFAALMRVVATGFDVLHGSWAPAVWAVAIATMLLGSTVGLVQSNLKPMLAYSTSPMPATCSRAWSWPVRSRRAPCCSTSWPMS